MAYLLYQTGTFQRMIGKNKFAASGSDDIDMILANQVFEMPEVCLVGYEIIALRLEPETLELRVADENVRTPRCGGAIFESGLAASQDERTAGHVEDGGREAPKCTG